MELKFHEKVITMKMNFIVWLVKKNYWKYEFCCLVGFRIVGNNEYKDLYAHTN